MPKTQASSITFYDDKQHDYRDFWDGRDYEHESELLAINKLLKGKHFAVAMDYGGGYGRLVPKLLKFADQVVLADPSAKQLAIGKDFLKNYPKVEFSLIEAKDSVPAADSSLDLLVMVRVSHHLPLIEPTFKAIYRALKPGGLAVIEIANEAHFLNRLRYLAKLKSVPKQPVPVGEVANGIKDETPFVNHHPKTIEALLRQQNLKVVKKMSVSNLRSPALKQRMNIKTMVAIEKLLQTSLAPIYFGPSIFLLVEKPS